MSVATMMGKDRRARRDEQGLLAVTVVGVLETTTEKENETEREIG